MQWNYLITVSKIFMISKVFIVNKIFKVIKIFGLLFIIIANHLLFANVLDGIDTNFNNIFDSNKSDAKLQENVPGFETHLIQKKPKLIPAI